MRAQDTANREAAGESLWTDAFDEQVLRRLATLWEVLESEELRDDYESGRYVATLMRLEGGWQVEEYLTPGHLATAGVQPPNFVLDLLDCVYKSLDRSKE